MNNDTNTDTRSQARIESEAKARRRAEVTFCCDTSHDPEAPCYNKRY